MVSDFSTENLKLVLQKLIDCDAELPQEVTTTELNRAIAKTIGKIHPLALGSFKKGMEQMGIIKDNGFYVIIYFGSDDI